MIKVAFENDSMEKLINDVWDFIDRCSDKEAFAGELTGGLKRAQTYVDAAAREVMDEVMEQAIQGDGGSAPITETVAAATPAPAPSIPAPPKPIERNVTVDSSGLPWDERIHARTKATIADGTWRRKRGVEDTVRASVEAELRERVAATAPDAPTLPPVAPPAPPVPEAPVAPPAPPVPEAPEAPVAPAAPDPSAITYPELMGRILREGKGSELGKVAQELGLNSIVALGQRPDLIPMIMEKLGME